MFISVQVRVHIDSVRACMRMCVGMLVGMSVGMHVEVNGHAHMRALPMHTRSSIRGADRARMHAQCTC